MRKGLWIAWLAFVLVAVVRAAPPSGGETAAPVQGTEVTYDGWLKAKQKAEEYARQERYVEALQHYLEYARIAQGLKRPDLVAWGKNNAAYMIIKMHLADGTVDLGPARKLLEEALAIPEASEPCRVLIRRNLDYVKSVLDRAG